MWYEPDQECGQPLVNRHLMILSALFGQLVKVLGSAYVVCVPTLQINILYNSTKTSSAYSAQSSSLQMFSPPTHLSRFQTQSACIVHVQCIPNYSVSVYM